MKYLLFMTVIFTLLFNVFSKVNVAYENMENKNSTEIVLLQYLK